MAIICEPYSVLHGRGRDSITPDVFMPLLAHVLCKRLRITILL